MKTARPKIDVFASTLSLQFNGDIVNFKIKYVDIPFDDFPVNIMDTISLLPKDCCELSNRVLQELFLDMKVRDDASKEMKRAKMERRR